jgi:hypothetical protein
MNRIAFTRLRQSKSHGSDLGDIYKEFIPDPPGVMSFFGRRREDGRDQTVGKRFDPAAERVIADIRWLDVDTGTTYATSNDCVRSRENARCFHIADRVTYRRQLPKRDGGGSSDRDTTNTDTPSLRNEHETRRSHMRGVGEAWECLHHGRLARNPDTSTAKVPDDGRRGLHMDREKI